MGAHQEKNIYKDKENARYFIEREMGRPYGKEILEIESQIAELKQKMIQLLKKRYEIEEQKRKGN